MRASILPGAASGAGLGAWVLVGDLFLDGSAFLKVAEFGKGSAKDEVGLGPGAVYRFLLLFGAFVHHAGWAGAGAWRFRLS